MIKWKYKPSGYCPVQAEGWSSGYYFYFRARGNKATIDFAKTETDWEYQRYVAVYTLCTTRNPYMAGYLPKWFCKVLIWIGCIIFYFRRNKNTITK